MGVGSADLTEPFERHWVSRASGPQTERDFDAGLLLGSAQRSAGSQVIAVKVGLGPLERWDTPASQELLETWPREAGGSLIACPREGRQRCLGPWCAVLWSGADRAALLAHKVKLSGEQAVAAAVADLRRNRTLEDFDHCSLLVVSVQLSNPVVNAHELYVATRWASVAAVEEACLGRGPCEGRPLDTPFEPLESEQVDRSIEGADRWWDACG